MDAESFRVTARNDAVTGVGTVIATFDVNGVAAFAPTFHKQDSALLHPNVVMNVELNASMVDKPLFVPTSGTWVLAKATSIRRVVAGGAGTAEITVAPSGTAPASGTTCMATANNITLDAPAADIILNSPLATTPVKCGVGSYFGLNVASTLTSLVGILTLEFQRIA